MEITNEIKAKVFAQYLGDKCEYKWIGEEEKLLLGKITPKIIESLCYNDGVITYCCAVLKPLSSITDEDKNELGGDILGVLDPEYFLNGLINKKMYSCSIHKTIEAIQFLQSKGYDIPQYLLGGKTLKEAGLAIYS